MKTVSILIPNYNYGCYLSECFDSILNQTYNDIEVIFSDNASTDDSMKIAESYRDKFSARNYKFIINQNNENIGSNMNSQICKNLSSGEYIYHLCSDDSIEPDFIKRCADILNNYNDVSFVITNRNEIIDRKISSSIPFYNKNCIIDGKEQSAVFMMSGVCMLSQMLYRKTSLEKVFDFRLKLRYSSDWQLGFLLSLVGNVGYLKDGLFNYRIHSGSESDILVATMRAPFEIYIMLQHFCEIAKIFKVEQPLQRYEEAIKKLAELCLRYSVNFLQKGGCEVAEKYLLLSKFFDNSISETTEYIIIKNALKNNDYDEINELYKKMYKRKISYDPPKTHITIDRNGVKLKND